MMTKNPMQLKAFIKNKAAEKHISAQLVMQNYKAVDYILRNRFNVDVRIGNTAPVTILHLLPKGKTTEDVAANLFPFAHTFHKCLIIREFHKQLLLPRYSVAVKSVSSSDNSIS